MRVLTAAIPLVLWSLSTPAGATETSCSNGLDDDGDTFVDCFDTDPAECGLDPACRNYLIIVVDDVGVDKVESYYSNLPSTTWTDGATALPHTPNIDELYWGADGIASTADDVGLRFTQAWAAPSCSPTRVSLQTGRWPHNHGIGGAIPNAGAGFDPATATEPMLAQVATTLSENPFDTGFFGKWHLGHIDAAGSTAVPTIAAGTFTTAPNPVIAGWDYFYGTLDGVIDGGDPALTNAGYNNWNAITWSGSPGTSATVAVHASPSTATAASNWVTGLGPGQRWLAMVSFHAPHEHDASASPTWTSADLDATCTRGAAYDPAPSCLGSASCTAAERNLWIYQNLLECADMNIATMLNTLAADADANLENTMIVFMGDNGTTNGVAEDVFFDGNGKGTVYETGIHVPLIIADGYRWVNGTASTSPMITSPREVNAHVHVLDLFSTLLDEWGAADDRDGRSLQPCFTSSSATCSAPAHYTYTETFDTPITQASAAARLGTDKVVMTYLPATATEPACMMQEFFDLTAGLPETSVPYSTSSANLACAEKDALQAYFTTTVAPSWASGLTVCGESDCTNAADDDGDGNIDCDDTADTCPP